MNINLIRIFPSLFGCSEDRPSPIGEDNGRNDHSECDQDSRLTDPQLCLGAVTRRIKRGLDNGVPGRVQRDRGPDAARLQPQAREHEAKCRGRDHPEQSRKEARRTHEIYPSQD